MLKTAHKIVFIIQYFKAFIRPGSDPQTRPFLSAKTPRLYLLDHSEIVLIIAEVLTFPHFNPIHIGLVCVPVRRACTLQ